VNLAWSDDLDEEGTNHFPLFQLGDVLFKYQPPLGLDLRLLPDGMLGEEFIGGRECRVMINVWVPFEQVPKRRSEFRQPGFSFFLFFGLQAIGVL